MPTSPTDPSLGGTRLLVLADEGTWLRVDAAGVDARGDIETPAEAESVVLAVPGTDVAIHWLELATGLAPAQAAAAARLLLADASAAPLGEMHVAIGRPEDGLTPAALVPAARMTEWLADAQARGLDPEAILPSTMLLAPPETGFVRRGLDHRGRAAAFALEPELAEALIGDAPVETVDAARFEAALPAILAAPPIDLRQGAFARRRQWRVDAGWRRRVAMLAILFAVLTLAVQIVTTLRYTFAADRLEAELAALGTAGAAPANPGFGATATRLFDAVRATPNLELARIEYRPDGSLSAAVAMDNPATFAAFRARAEASGLAVEAGPLGTGGGRPTAELTVRPS